MESLGETFENEFHSIFVIRRILAEHWANRGTNCQVGDLHLVGVLDFFQEILQIHSDINIKQQKMGQILSALIRKGIVAANAKKFSVKVSRVLSTQFPELFNMIAENSGTFPPVSSCPSRLEHYPSARDQKGQDDSHRNLKNIHRKSSTKRVVIEKQTTYRALECSAPFSRISAWNRPILWKQRHGTLSTRDSDWVEKFLAAKKKSCCRLQSERRRKIVGITCEPIILESNKGWLLIDLS